ncbi:NUDIX hydrolase [Cognatishimia sp. 1_MG-2023]|uniref:NUDIX hydrolase n=1 Tax=Cognatishimia sp. 1_MG-2023 TaxID=3062642 RepID=UPI0026E35116|nr:NUDIX hydrolase [Cognatishimia sp. 1_MG-2023]MDO6727074.1 NUDIX hydrolase [Cognatishimia sp. 1_MG-2023]
MIRRFGTPPEAERRYIRRPGAYVVLLQGDDMLVTREDRSDVGIAPEFQLPGGGIDPGESPIPALHREVMEETGWTMASPRRLGAFRRFVFMPEYDLWADKICTIYVARPVRRFGPPLEDGHTAIWMPRDQATRLLANVGDRHFAQRARF